MQKDIQRIRNLTTGIVHTKMEDVYDDLEIIMGTKGLDPHRLPQALSAVKPWLREHIANIYFWDGKYDPVHRGEITLPEPTDKERKLMLDRYNASPDPQINKSMKLYNIETLLMQKIAEFTRDTARIPTAIYLGTIEFFEFEKMIIDKQMSLQLKGISDFCGCKVYKVFKTTHCKVV